MTAARAYELGLVNQVVAMDKLDATVDEWLADILRCAPLAVRATKEASYSGLEMSLGDAITHSFHGQRVMSQSEDTVEGPRAFAEKREPNWKAK